jgi:FAD:protein FMN transferase
VRRPVAAITFPLWSTTATVLVTDRLALPEAVAELRLLTDRVEAAASRFRADSEVQLLLRRPGHAVPVSPLLVDLLQAADTGWRLSAGLVDPTVATAVIALGYAGDIDTLHPAPVLGTGPARGWPAVDVDPIRGLVTVPAGVALDLGATAKAWTADVAADRLADRLGCGVLVNLGGDVAVAGPAPAGGWTVGIGDDHRVAAREPQQVVTLITGGLATSSTTVRRWRRGAGWAHHLVDPRTGENPPEHWRTVSVTATSCLLANVAATTAVLLGPDAPGWLGERDLPARLVDIAGRTTAVAGWPAYRAVA